MNASYDAATVGLSILIAAFASYVALDLARRVRTRDPFSVWVWTIGGALVMGSGIWSMHFVGMLGFSLPVPIGYEPVATFISWIAAVAVSALALRLAARDTLDAAWLAGGSLAMGAGICAMHYTGMAALQMAPGIVWNWPLVAASAVIACAASAAALWIFFAMRGLAGAKARVAQGGAAIVMGAAISGMHYTAMAAAGFPEGAYCISAGGLGGQTLGTTIVLGTVMLLSVTLFTSVLDARMQAHANSLADSLKVANDELRRLAFLDPLTGVPNRMLLEDRLGHAVARIDRARARGGRRAMQMRLGLLFIDLDGFKPVNDSFGHAAGDTVLRQVAERLSLIAREADTLARVGGDEFVLLIDDIASAADAATLAGRILEALRQPFEIGKRKVTLSCSIGIAVYPDHGHRERLLACADAAMYNAKRAGGSGCAVFESHMQDGVSDQLDLQQALREALESNQLRLAYQPKIATGSGRVVGVEALLRWKHPTRGPVSPAVFIPVAERFGLIVAIGRWVIDEAIRQLADWTAQGMDLTVSINLSAYQLRNLEAVERLEQALHRHGVNPARVICEITESVAMEDTQATQQVIEALSALGVQLSIDDFGTGYSSLASLRQLKIHELKIDRSFIKDVAQSADARAVVDAVVHLAHALGLRVVAEGVETPAQRDMLQQLASDELQGFHFAAALAPEELTRWMRRQEPQTTIPAGLLTA